MPETIEHIIQIICERITDGPVGVQVTESNWSLILELTVSPEQYGRLIGKEGRTIMAIRRIAQAMGAGKKRVLVELCEAGELGLFVRPDILTE